MNRWLSEMSPRKFAVCMLMHTIIARFRRRAFLNTFLREKVFGGVVGFLLLTSFYVVYSFFLDIIKNR